MPSSQAIFWLKVLGTTLLLGLRFVWIVPAAALRYWLRRLLPGKGAERPALFFYSQVVWQEVWQRPQEFARGMACKCPVIFFGPAQVHRLYDTMRKKRWLRRRDYKEGCGLTVITPLQFSGEYKSRLIEAVNRVLIRAEARWVLAPWRRIIFVTNSPFCDDLVECLDYERLVYDVIDEYVSFSWSPQGSGAREGRVLSRADLLIAGTWRLWEKKKELHPRCVFVPSGVAFEHFQCNGKPRTTPASLEGLPRPILGYMGSLSDRIDHQILEKLSEAFPRGSVVLIGPVHGSFGKPPSARNIHYLGLVDHRVLPDYLSAFDVALMPFALNEATRHINPVKTLEYLAAGKPVVSTRVPDVVRFYSDYLYLADSPDDFVSKVREALERPQAERIARGIELARGSSWGTMVEKMASELEALSANDAGE